MMGRLLSPASGGGALPPAEVGISAATGTLSHGSSLTITGGGFGTKASAPPQFFDTVDDFFVKGVKTSDPYSALIEGNAIPTGAGNPWDTVRALELEKTKVLSQRTNAYRLASVDSSVEFPRDWPNPTTGEVEKYYATWKYRVNQDPDTVAAHKFHRVWDTTGSFESGLRVSWSYDLLGATTGTAGTMDFANTIPTLNVWNVLEEYMDVSKKDGTDQCNGTLNGTVTVDHTGSDFYDAGTLQGIQPRLLGIDARATSDWPSSGATYEGQIADIWMDITPKRVVLTNAATWATSTKREPQMATSWSDTEVIVTLNQGDLGAISGMYLYVIDDENDPIDTDGFQL